MAKLSDPNGSNDAHGQQQNGADATSSMDTSGAVAQNAVHVMNPAVMAPQFTVPPNYNVSFTVQIKSFKIGQRKENCSSCLDC